MTPLSRTPITVIAALALAAWAAACSRDAGEGRARREVPAAARSVERVGGWALAVLGDMLFIVGGMLRGQHVTGTVQLLEPRGGSR